MKKVYLVILLVGFACVSYSQITYTWSGASGVGASWTISTNWTPNRTTPATNDILVFNGATVANPIVNSMPATETIGALKIINNANLILGTASNSVITVGNVSVSAPHFSVSSGSKLLINSIGNTVSLNIPTGCTGIVSDSIIFSGDAHRLTAFDAGALVFQNGAAFRAASNFAGNAFGTTNISSVVFQSGSKYISESGATPFGSTTTPPNAVAVFQKGSLYLHKQTNSPSLTGRTYANFEIDAPTFNQSLLGNTPCRIDTFTITNVGTLNLNLPGGFVISGNMSVVSGTINFNPASAASILFDGTVSQKVSGTFTLSSNMKFVIASGANVSLQTGINTPDSINVYGKLYTNTQTANGNVFYLPAENYSSSFTGTSAASTNQITITTPGTALYSGMKITGTGIPADTYVMKTAGNIVHLSRYATSGGAGITFTASTSRGTLGIGSPNGITAAGASGNIQSTTRNYNTEANYEYTGTTAQVTGTGLPSSVKKLVLNTSGYQTISLTNNVNIDDSLSLQNGFLATTSSALPTLRDTTDVVSPSSNYLTYGSVSNIGWEKSFIKGPVARQISTTTIKWFPTGKISGTDTLFAPIALTKANNNPVSDTAEYFPAMYSDTACDHGLLDHVSVLEYWKMNCNLTTADAYGKVTLSWRPYSKVGDGNSLNDATALNNLLATHYIDADGAGSRPFLWYVEGSETTMSKGAGSTVNYGTLITTNANSPFSNTYTSPYFTLGTSSGFNILPLKLLDFSATPNQNSIALKWITKEEKQVAFYEVEHSCTGSSFSILGKISSINSFPEHVYSVVDTKPCPGWNYYLLKITEASGKVTYSAIIPAWMGPAGQLIVFPNPAQKEIKIILPGPRSIYTLAIVNSAGQVVKQLTTTQTPLTINIESLSKGLYTVKAFSNQQAFIQRFSIQ